MQNKLRTKKIDCLKFYAITMTDVYTYIHISVDKVLKL